jgi:hypothetical protein
MQHNTAVQRRPRTRSTSGTVCTLQSNLRDWTTKSTSPVTDEPGWHAEWASAVCRPGGDCAGADGGDELAILAGAREDADGGIGPDRVRCPGSDTEGPAAACLRASTQGEFTDQMWRVQWRCGCSWRMLFCAHNKQNVPSGLHATCFYLEAASGLNTVVMSYVADWVSG